MIKRIKQAASKKKHTILLTLVTLLISVLITSYSFLSEGVNPKEVIDNSSEIMQGIRLCVYAACCLFLYSKSSNSKKKSTLITIAVLIVAIEVVFVNDFITA